jgi:hypothetical protein
MRIRATSPSGDYVLGQWYVDDSNVTKQILQQRLNLFEFEWFLDNTYGLPLNEILGYQKNSRDLVIQNYILNSLTVDQIISYSSTITSDRQFIVTATVSSIYGGQVTVTTTL